MYWNFSGKRIFLLRSMVFLWALAVLIAFVKFIIWMEQFAPV